MSNGHSFTPWTDPKILYAFVMKSEISEEEKPKAKRAKVSVPKTKKQPDYVEDIQKMMHAFGDVANPMESSATILENIAQSFTENLIKKLVQQKELKKDKKKLTVEDVISNISDTLKCKRAWEVVRFLQRHKGFSDKQTPDELLDEEEVISNAESNKSELDIPDILPEKPLIKEESPASSTSDISLERLKYRDAISKDMTTSEYLFYAECSKVSFTRPYKRKRFVAWCKLDNFGISYSTEVVDLIGELVYEHLEGIVRSIKQDNLMTYAILPAQIEKFKNVL